MTLRQPHDCVRCGSAISPDDEFAAVDVLDPDGELHVLLCVTCSSDLRAFLDGSAADGDE